MQTDVRSVRAPEESARAFVYRVLSTYIKEMFLHPGEKLAETDVAAELQVSRTPVHDTFSRLRAREDAAPGPPRGRGAAAERRHDPPDGVDAPHGLPGRFGRIVQSPPRPRWSRWSVALRRSSRRLQGGAIVKMARLQLGVPPYPVLLLAGREPVMEATGAQQRLICTACFACSKMPTSGAMWPTSIRPSCRGWRCATTSWPPAHWKRSMT